MSISLPRVLVREDHELGLSCSVTIIVTEIAPKDAPESGADWPEELDYPRVRGYLVIHGARVPAALHGVLILERDYPLESHSGEECRSQGPLAEGNLGDGRAGRRFWNTYSGPSLAELVETALAVLREAVDVLRAHVAARIARLEQREQTLARARATWDEAQQAQAAELRAPRSKRRIRLAQAQAEEAAA
jgi:hypothetical protein